MLRALAISLLLAACGSKSNPAPSNNGSDTSAGSGSGSAAACVVGGCSGTMCSERTDIMSTCEFKNEYACYRTATCERQPDGQCGWTQSDALKACLANPPAP